MELVIYKLVSLEHPENQRAHRIARNLFTLKLLLIPILLPFYLTLCYELTQSSEGYLPPILDFISSYLLLTLFCVTAGWVLLLPIIPGIGYLAIVPIRSFQYFIGINLEVFYIIPRIFLGSIVDLLQPRKTSPSAPVLYSAPVALFLLVLIPLVTMLTTSAWGTLYARIASTHPGPPKPLTENQRILAEIWNDSREVAFEAKTMGEAYAALAQLRSLVPMLDFYNEVERKRLHDTIRSAELHLQDCNDKGRTAYEQWQPKYLNFVGSLASVPLPTKNK